MRAITLEDVRDMIAEFPDLPVEFNKDGNYTGVPSGKVMTQGSYIGYIMEAESGSKRENLLEELNYLEEENYGLDRQAFVWGDEGKMWMVTSVDHIQFDEFDLIELYCEQIG